MDINKTKNLFEKYLDNKGDAQFNILYKKNDNSIVNQQLRLGLTCYDDTAFDTNNIDKEIIIAASLKLLFEFNTHLKSFRALNVLPPFVNIHYILLNILTHTKGYEYTDISREKNVYTDPRYGYINISIKKNNFIKDFMKNVLQTHDYHNRKNIFDNNFNQIIENINNNLTYTYSPIY
jgi:hypothetical protein